MASNNNKPADETPRVEGTSSVRVAIVGFLITLLVLAVMGVYWLFIRV
jgi:hypothetical protein